MVHVTLALWMPVWGLDGLKDVFPRGGGIVSVGEGRERMHSKRSSEINRVPQNTAKLSNESIGARQVSNPRQAVGLATPVSATSPPLSTQGCDLCRSHRCPRVRSEGVSSVARLPSRTRGLTMEHPNANVADVFEMTVPGLKEELRLRGLR